MTAVINNHFSVSALHEERMIVVGKTTEACFDGNRRTAAATNQFWLGLQTGTQSGPAANPPLD